MAVTQRPKSPIQPAGAPVDYEPKGLSPKARNYIAVGVLAFCLIVGGGIVWFFLFGSSPKRRTVAVSPSQQTVAMPGMRYAPQPPRNLKGVNKLGNDRWLIRGDAGSLMVVNKGGGSYEFQPLAPKDLGLSTEQIALLAAKFRISADPLMAKEWKVTDDQARRLGIIPMGNVGAQVKADTAALRPLWDEYLKASDGPTRLDAQKKLTDKIDASAKANNDAVKKVYLDRIEQIRQILTPEQLQTITKK